MSHPLSFRCVTLLILTIGGLLPGCARGEPESAGDAVPAEFPQPPEPPEVGVVPAHTVGDWAGPGGHPFEVTTRLPGDPTHLHRVIGSETFPLTLRTGEGTLVQWPCTSCHEGVTITADRDADAHGNIDPVHPSRLGQVCSTCHVPSAVDQLRLSTGEIVSLDHAYRLCAECHFQQVESWAAGAHGKRLYGWSGRRVVMNCADCHDPHTPSAPQRIPYPGPQLPTPRGGAR